MKLSGILNLESCRAIWLLPFWSSASKSKNFVIEVLHYLKNSEKLHLMLHLCNVEAPMRRTIPSSQGSHKSSNYCDTDTTTAAAAVVPLHKPSKASLVLATSSAYLQDPKPSHTPSYFQSTIIPPVLQPLLRPLALSPIPQIESHFTVALVQCGGPGIYPLFSEGLPFFSEERPFFRTAGNV